MRTPRIIGGGLSKIPREREVAKFNAEMEAVAALQNARLPTAGVILDGRIVSPDDYNRTVLSRAAVNRQESADVYVPSLSRLAPVSLVTGYNCYMGMLKLRGDGDLYPSERLPPGCTAIGIVVSLVPDEPMAIPDDYVWRFTLRAGSHTMVDIFADCRTGQPPRFDWGPIHSTGDCVTQVPTPKTRVRFDQGRWIEYEPSMIYIGASYA